MKRKLLQLEALQQMLKEVGQEYARMSEDPEILRLRQAYNEAKEKLARACNRGRVISGEIKAMKEDISELYSALGKKMPRWIGKVEKN